MAEADTIREDALPLTVESLAAGFRRCGLAAGQTVKVHCAMSRLGWVAGGPQAVILALLEVLGPSGTLVMPTHTSNNTDPAHWQNPPVPAHWVPIIREQSPAYDPYTSPTRQMGAVAELFRTWPGVVRSTHPIVSCAARGKHAEWIVSEHPLEDASGERSPLARLYALDAHVLLIGVDHSNNTSLHLAEVRASYPGKTLSRNGTSMMVNGQRRWVEFEWLEPDSDDFQQIGEAFERVSPVRIEKVGGADVRFFRQREAVDFAVSWMETHRDFSLPRT